MVPVMATTLRPPRHLPIAGTWPESWDTDRTVAIRCNRPSGRWLAVHASCLRAPGGLPGPTAVVIEPAKSAQIAPIIVEAYCLTAREQQVTQAVARGLSNPEIATQMHLSAHTCASISKRSSARWASVAAENSSPSCLPIITAPHCTNQARRSHTSSLEPRPTGYPRRSPWPCPRT